MKPSAPLMCGNRVSRSGIGMAAARTEPMTDALDRLGVPRQTAATLAGLRPGSALFERVRDDFECGRTTEVDGWVLSTTEVAVAVVAWGEHGA